MNNQDNQTQSTLIIENKTDGSDYRLLSDHYYPFLIGKNAENHCVLGNASVEDYHAMIIYRNGDWHIIDLITATGVTQGGQQVKSSKLRSGDILKIADYELNIRIENTDGDILLSKKRLISSHILVQVEGPEIAKTYELKQYRTTIGRAPDNAVRIDDPTISSHHAYIEKSKNHLVIYDKKSTNGLFVNLNRVEQSELNNGDLIGIGRSELRYIHLSQVE